MRGRGGIGRRSVLKARRRKMYPFESGRPHVCSFEAFDNVCVAQELGLQGEGLGLQNRRGRFDPGSSCRAHTFLVLDR